MDFLNSAKELVSVIGLCVLSSWALALDNKIDYGTYSNIQSGMSLAEVSDLVTQKEAQGRLAAEMAEIGKRIAEIDAKIASNAERNNKQMEERRDKGIQPMQKWTDSQQHEEKLLKSDKRSLQVQSMAGPGREFLALVGIKSEIEDMGDGKQKVTYTSTGKGGTKSELSIYFVDGKAVAKEFTRKKGTKILAQDATKLDENAFDSAYGKDLALNTKDVTGYIKGNRKTFSSPLAAANYKGASGGGKASPI